MRFSAFEAWAVAVGATATVIPDRHNAEYEAGVVEIRGEQWHIRTARTTPLKSGAFVAFWERDANGKTVPFRDDHASAGVLVFVEQPGGRGVFRFTSAHLADLGVTSGRRVGKRGFRVYPSWCAGLNAQAAATQRAQASAFQEY